MGSSHVFAASWSACASPGSCRAFADDGYSHYFLWMTRLRSSRPRPAPPRHIASRRTVALFIFMPSAGRPGWPLFSHCPHPSHAQWVQPGCRAYKPPQCNKPISRPSCSPGPRGLRRPGRADGPAFGAAAGKWNFDAASSCLNRPATADPQLFHSPCLYPLSRWQLAKKAGKKQSGRCFACPAPPDPHCPTLRCAAPGLSALASLASPASPATLADEVRLTTELSGAVASASLGLTRHAAQRGPSLLPLHPGMLRPRRPDPTTASPLRQSESADSNFYFDNIQKNVFRGPQLLGPRNPSGQQMNSLIRHRVGRERPRGPRAQ